MKKLNLAIIGQGRSGKNIHGLFYRSESNVYYNVKYVVDADEHRRNVAKELYLGCETFEDYTEIFGLDDIDLVVNASYSEMHFEITKELLQHKFNVLVEKPFARNRYECEELIKLSKENNVLLAVFQQAFFAPFYLKTKEVMESGVLGDIKQINIAYNGFSRRWDWQTLQKKLAGGVYNTGPHPIGIALGLIDFDKTARVAFSRLSKALTSGDSDDCAKIIIEAVDKPFIDIEVNSNDAYAPSNIKILGSRGTFITTFGEYKYTYIKDGENPERPVIETFLKDENGEPIFCGEQLIKHEETGKVDAGGAFTTAVTEIYKDIYYAITENKPMRVTAQMATEIVAIIDKVHTDNPLPLIY